MPDVFLTGGTGFVGGALLRRLIAPGLALALVGILAVVAGLASAGIENRSVIGSSRTSPVLVATSGSANAWTGRRISTVSS